MEINKVGIPTNLNEHSIGEHVAMLEHRLSAMTAERDGLRKQRKEWIRDETRMNRLINAQESQIKEMTTERDGLKESRDTALRMLTREQDARIRDFAPLCDKIAALEKERDEAMDLLRAHSAALGIRFKQLAVARAALRAIHNNSSDGYIDPTLTDSSEKVEDYASYTLAAIEALEGNEDALAAITSLEKTAGTEGGVRE